MKPQAKHKVQPNLNFSAIATLTCASINWNMFVFEFFFLLVMMIILRVVLQFAPIPPMAR